MIGYNLLENEMLLLSDKNLVPLYIPCSLRKLVVLLDSENIARVPSSVPGESTVKFSFHDNFPSKTQCVLENHKNHLVSSAIRCPWMCPEFRLC